ncbi:MAG: ABC transporter ATP-binding protein/permease [Lachnospiraceae bacterium]|nr:ABC transporter ATP-binding protein/permease [Lachnospiraceae bacterium]
MKFMLSYLKRYRWLVAACMSLKLLGTILELLIPYVLEYMIDEVAPTKQMSLVLLWGAVMLALAALTRLTNVTANRLSVKSAKSATYEIRRDLFWHSLNLSGSQTDKFGLPSLTSRMTSDSYNVQSFLQSGQALGVRAPIMLVGGIVITMTMDVGLSAILCVMAPVMLVVTVAVSLWGIPLYDKVQQSVDEIVRIMRENITGIRVVKALSKEDYERRRFGAANETMTRRERKAGVVMALPGPLMTLALNIGLTLVVVIGAIRVNNGVTKPGVILAFLTYFNMILMGVMGLNRVFMMLSKATASAKRIEAVIAQPEGLAAIPEEQAAYTDREEFIVFDHVSFRYGEASGKPGDITQTSAAETEDSEKMKQTERLASVGKSAGRAENTSSGEEPTVHEGIQMSISELSFAMKKGGSLGIIGATGCGKTTVINLLMRFYDPTEGHIFVDGKDVRTYEKDDLRRKFGVVFQNDVIFAESLAENIDFGRSVDEEGIRTAAANARAQEFIEAYDDTYQHRAAIHGANLSGGQRQRVLIARALAAHPEILVLDDASSALDYKTDAALRKVIREEYRDTTTIVVAQRISSIMSLDDIIMLDEGDVIGHGTHEELMASCPKYREIYHTQMGEGR